MERSIEEKNRLINDLKAKYEELVNNFEKVFAQEAARKNLDIKVPGWLPDTLAIKSLFDVFLKNKVIEYCSWYILTFYFILFYFILTSIKNKKIIYISKIRIILISNHWGITRIIYINTIKIFILYIFINILYFYFWLQFICRYFCCIQTLNISNIFKYKLIRNNIILFFHLINFLYLFF